jgi:diguanylate cyclase
MPMPSVFEVFTSLGHSVGLLALVGLAYSALVQHVGRPAVRQALIGLLFGAGAVISMLDPVTIRPGLMADIRNVLVALSGPYGGPLATLVCAIVASAYRLWVGGVGGAASVVGIITAGVAGLIFTAWADRTPDRLRLRHLLVLATLAPVCLFNIALVPRAVATAFLSQALLPLAAATWIGVLLLGTLFTRELRRIRAEAELRSAATTDPVTGLLNRRGFDDALARAVAGARRHERRLTLLAIDVDYFKRVNDELGHEAGDEALRAVGAALRDGLGADDAVGRVGGDEFAVLTTGGMADALALAERLRGAVEAAKLPFRKGYGTLSASIGLAAFDPAGDGRGLQQQADEALYLAKAAGRNRVSAVQLRGVNAAA